MSVDPCDEYQGRKVDARPEELQNPQGSLALDWQTAFQIALVWYESAYIRARRSREETMEGRVDV